MISDLYPICRSITGEGVRQTLRVLQKCAPLTVNEVPTGTQVFDWVVPKEWNIRDAFIKNSNDERVIDFHKSNLHVVNYSVPIKRKLRLPQLRDHLFSLPDAPDWIPYRTSYYRETWGFCLSQRQFESLPDEEFEVCIDSTLEPGSLTYGELRIPGASEKEVLLSTHCCHPSLCNDNLSGVVIAAKLAQLLTGKKLRYSYRILWVPGTIGAISWLALHPTILPNIEHGLVLSCLGDPGRFTYKRSRRGKADIDRIVEQVLLSSKKEFESVDFTPLGYDERQYCSPGINLPVGSFMRTPNGKYPQYHTSADDLSLVSPVSLGESMQILLRIVRALESNHTYLNQNPACEPQLGRRGLYRQMGGLSSTRFEESVLWVLNFSDGHHSLLDIAERSDIPLEILADASTALVDCGLLNELETPSPKCSYTD
jgi:aminopeptidase-like protein